MSTPPPKAPLLGDSNAFFRSTTPDSDDSPTTPQWSPGSPLPKSQHFVSTPPSSIQGIPLSPLFPKLGEVIPRNVDSPPKDRNTAAKPDSALENPDLIVRSSNGPGGQHSTGLGTANEPPHRHISATKHDTAKWVIQRNPWKNDNQLNVDNASDNFTHVGEYKPLPIFSKFTWSTPVTPLSHTTEVSGDDRWYRLPLNIDGTEYKQVGVPKRSELLPTWMTGKKRASDAVQQSIEKTSEGTQGRREGIEGEKDVGRAETMFEVISSSSKRLKVSPQHATSPRHSFHDSPLTSPGHSTEVPATIPPRISTPVLIFSTSPGSHHGFSFSSKASISGSPSPISPSSFQNHGSAGAHVSQTAMVDLVHPQSDHADPGQHLPETTQHRHKEPHIMAVVPPLGDPNAFFGYTTPDHDDYSAALHQSRDPSPPPKPQGHADPVQPTLLGHKEPQRTDNSVYIHTVGKHRHPLTPPKAPPLEDLNAFFSPPAHEDSPTELQRSPGPLFSKPQHFVSAPTSSQRADVYQLFPALNNDRHFYDYLHE
ncbi:hypothetical protein H0H93_008201 [Arthromyces matolae]|nr:hypothetical protein H0H93_008201 [Arthromyces matolae]